MNVITLESTSRTVAVGDLTIHYHEAGEGAPLLLLHGGGPGACGWMNYERNVAALAARYRVLVPDLVGFGKSSRVPVTDTLYKFHGRIVLGFMDALGVDRAHVVGNSLSGGVALRLMLDHPERIGRAILLGPGGAIPLFSGWPTLGLKLGMAYYAGEGPTREKLRELLRMMVWDKTLITDELVERRYLSSVEGTTGKHPPLGKSGKLADEPLWRENLGAIPHDILMAWGKEDDILPLDGAFFLLRQIPNAELRVLSKCGHWVMWERAEEFNRIALEFLGRESTR